MFSVAKEVPKWMVASGISVKNAKTILVACSDENMQKTWYHFLNKKK